MSLNLSGLEFTKLSESIDYIFCQILLNFSHYVSEYFFQLHLFSALYLRLQWYKYYICCNSLVSPWGSDHLLKSIFSLLFKFSNFCSSLFKLTDSFFCPLHYTIKPSHWSLYFSHCIFSSKFLFGFLYLLVFAETFYLFICFKHVHNCSSRYLYDDCLKILVT